MARCARSRPGCHAACTVGGARRPQHQPRSAGAGGAGRVLPGERAPAAARAGFRRAPRALAAGPGLPSARALRGNAGRSRVLASPALRGGLVCSRGRVLSGRAARRAVQPSAAAGEGSGDGAAAAARRARAGSRHMWPALPALRAQGCRVTPPSHPGPCLHTPGREGTAELPGGRGARGGLGVTRQQRMGQAQFWCPCPWRTRVDVTDGALTAGGDASPSS